MTDRERIIEEARAAVLPANLRFDESWGKLTGESGLAYEAFCAYRDFGPDRNIRRAVEGQFRKAELPTEFSPPAKTPRRVLSTGSCSYGSANGTAFLLPGPRGT